MTSTVWSGWIYKQKGSTSQLDHLYCVLKDCRFSFYSRKGGREKGYLSMSDLVSVEPLKDPSFQDSHRHRILLHDKEGRTELFITHCQEDFGLWMDGIRHYADKCSHSIEVHAVNEAATFHHDEGMSDGLMDNVTAIKGGDGEGSSAESSDDGQN